jgi:IS605 OrfB family transposase
MLPGRIIWKRRMHRPLLPGDPPFADLPSHIKPSRVEPLPETIDSLGSSYRPATVDGPPQFLFGFQSLLEGHSNDLGPIDIVETSHSSPGVGIDSNAHHVHPLICGTCSTDPYRCSTRNRFGNLFSQGAMAPFTFHWCRHVVVPTYCSSLVPVFRGLTVPLASALPPAVLSLMAAYRLLTNEVLRQAILSGTTSKGALSRFARDRAFVHQLTGEHAVVASGIALSLAKGHRRRLRDGIEANVPYIRRLFLRTSPKTFHLDIESGKVRISRRNGEWCSFQVHLSAYHRERLREEGVRIKQLQVSIDRVILFLEKPAPEPYRPTSLLALDTNESSMDGATVTLEGSQLAQVPYPGLRVIQATHFDRRRKLQRKKAHDRRVARRLLKKEGVRERHRVRSRLHELTSRLLDILAHQHAALALEDLTRMARPRRRGKGKARRHWVSPKTRRRLSSWPRRELHRQLEYKAVDRGIPVYWVNPWRTSITCPRCGEITRPRSRVGPTFTCAHCGWKMDRQLNAGLNVGRTALREIPELGGLQLDLDALSNDAMMPLYPFEESDGHGRSGGRGRESEGSSPKGEGYE